MDFLQQYFLLQVKAARSLLGWSQQDLAKNSGVSLSTLNRLERGGGDPSVGSLRAIHKTLESAGIRFINEPDGRIGVCVTREGLATGEATGQ